MPSFVENLHTMIQFTSAEEALKAIQPGHNIYIHTAAAAPQVLVNALAARSHELSNINIYQMHTEGEAPYADASHGDTFHVNSFFVGANVRQAIKEGRGSYIPMFLSEVPVVIRKRIIPIHVALISVSPPNAHGYVNLGVSIDASLAAVEAADIVIAQVNKNMPRTHGYGDIHCSRITYFVEGNLPIPEHAPEAFTAVEKQIGLHIANIIEDRSTLQMGIGNIPNAVLDALGSHKDLGIHTEMFSDGLIPLIEKGIVTGKYKKRYKNKIVSSFVFGSRKLYDFIDDNPLIEMLPADYVNDTYVIASNPRVVAINSAIEIDITGQVCADSIGYKMYSGVGGQMDFIRGASLSEGGKPILAIPSVTAKGISRISGHLNEGAGVVTTRAHIHYVVTEYGVANLYGKTLKQRAKAMIEIAHPDHREALDRTAFERFKRQ